MLMNYTIGDGIIHWLSMAYSGVVVPVYTIVLSYSKDFVLSKTLLNQETRNPAKSFAFARRLLQTLTVNKGYFNIARPIVVF